MNLQQLLDTYRLMDVPIRRYFVYYIGGSIIASSGLYTLLIYLIGTLVPNILLFTSSLIPTFIAVLYPFLILSRKEMEIDSNFPLFVTHITALSYTNTDRVGIFKRIARSPEYGSLSDEIGYMVALIETFNMSLDDAARRRSKEVNSELMSDFYEKLSYNLSSGNSLNQFLVDEQEDVREIYAARYQKRLSNLGQLGELFLTANISVALLLVFSIITPVLISIDAQLLILFVFGLYIVVQIIFLILINSKSPRDPVWYVDDDVKTDKIRNIRVSVIIGIIGVVVASFITMNLNIPVFAKFIISVQPLIIPSVIIFLAENKIDKAENQFSGFIRGLGSIESVKKTSTKNVLKSLKNKDFGALSDHIDDLYKRLLVSSKNTDSWKIFNAEINSYIIKKFSNMYVEAREMGGNPEEISKIVSENYRRLKKLRTQRSTTSYQLRGKLYGMTVAWSSVMFIVVNITEQIIEITSDLGGGNLIGNILNSASYDIQMVRVLIYASITINILLVSIMIRISQRKRILGFTAHIVVLITLCFGAGWLIDVASPIVFE